MYKNETKQVIDEVEKIEKAIPLIKEMVNEGLIVTTDIDVVKYGSE